MEGGQPKRQAVGPGPRQEPGAGPGLSNTAPAMAQVPLEAAGVPQAVAAAYMAQGIHALRPYQAQCFATPGVLEGTRNLVCVAPTSAGKSVVGEVAIAAALDARRCTRALYVTPLLSVATERATQLRAVLSGLLVDGRPPSVIDAVRVGVDPLGAAVGVCTPERAHGAVRRLVTSERLDELGIVVVDEAHTFSEEGRGPAMECLVALVLRSSRRLRRPIQLVLLSGTLPNAADVAAWVDGALVEGTVRPVALEHLVLVQGRCLRRLAPGPGHDAVVEALRRGKIRPSEERLKAVVDHLRMGQRELQVLIFCGSRDRTETIAALLAGARDQHPPPTPLERRLTAAGVHPKARAGAWRGVLAHHAGLSFPARQAVEDSFRLKEAWAIVCTSTLAHGVNLPASAVVLYDLFAPRGDRSPISAADYHQMAGRAGRAGLSAEGVVISVPGNAEPIAGAREEAAAEALIVGARVPATSRLAADDEALCGLAFDALATDAARQLEDVAALFGRTFARTA